jgi:hypothetical protein
MRLMLLLPLALCACSADPTPAAYLIAWNGGPRSESYVEDQAARGISYEVGSDGRVQAIHAGGPSIQYVEGCA